MSRIFCLLSLFSTIYQTHSFGLAHSSLTQVYGDVTAYTAARNSRLQQRCLHLTVKDEDLGKATIDRQSDEKYGRGISHISADLSEGDVIAYQDGTWYVDGNEVGDDSGPLVRYLLVDTIQLVWTHNCEHGVINGFSIMIAEDDAPVSVGDSGDVVKEGSYFVIQDDYIQCAPEQILAKLPARTSERKWKDTESEMLLSIMRFVPDEEITTA